MQKRKTKNIALLTLFFVSFFWIFPMIWAVFTSFKGNEEIQKVGFRILPNIWTLTNYQELLLGNDSAPVLKWFLNSIIISTGHMLLVVVVVALAAYGYSRLNFKGRDFIFLILLGSMVFPNMIHIIPSYKIVEFLGWLNTIFAVMIPGVANVYYVFLVRQFALGIPKELDESAFIDGANEFQIFLYIILPLLRPALLVVALFSFTNAWNDFLWPSIVINDIEKMPITPGLQLLQGQYMTYPGIGTAGAILALIPTFIMFLVAQKHFMQSMSFHSGIK